MIGVEIYPIYVPRHAIDFEMARKDPKTATSIHLSLDVIMQL